MDIASFLGMVVGNMMSPHGTVIVAALVIGVGRWLHKRRKHQG